MIARRGEHQTCTRVTEGETKHTVRLRLSEALGARLSGGSKMNELAYMDRKVTTVASDENQFALSYVATQTAKAYKDATPALHLPTSPPCTLTGTIMIDSGLNSSLQITRLRHRTGH